MNTKTTTPAESVTAAGPQHRPSTAGYWLGGAITVLAIVAAMAWAGLTFVRWMNQVDNFARTSAPGVVAVTVTEPGTRVIYLETERSQQIISTPSITVTDPTGALVAVRPYGAELKYDVPWWNGRAGQAVAQFDATRPGAYQVAVGPVTGPNSTVVAVGENLLWNAVPHGVGIAAVLVFGVGAGVSVMVVTGIRRSRSST